MKGLRNAAAGKSGPALEGRIRSVLSDLAPLLRIEHCALELVNFDPGSGDLTIRIAGSCPDCSGSPAMFSTAIEAHIRQRVAEVRQVHIEA